MIYLQLFLSYLKIGFFGFGGGYSMLSLIHNEVVTQHEWITSAALSDIVAISQMTPGPIAINSATYIGFTVAGFWGAVVATVAVCLPSLTIMALITRFFLQLKGNRYIECIMATMKPVVLGMIGAASLLLIFPAEREAASMIDAWSWILFALAFVASLKRIDPIRLILLSAVAGIAIYYVPTLYAEESEPIAIETKMLEGFDLSDKNIIESAEFEQAFVNYLYILERSDLATAKVSLEATMAEVAEHPNTMLHIADLGEKYLYNPLSEMRNDELFIPILQAITVSAEIDDIDKLRPTMLLERVKLNRIGTVAADFDFVQRGETTAMHSVKAPHTILYFENPDCSDCTRVSQIIESDHTIGSMLDDGSLALAKTNPDIEQSVNSRYDIKALPTLYLLDEDKRVVLKDATIEKIIEYLQPFAK